MTYTETASAVTTFLICTVAAQTAELCCEAVLEIICLQKVVSRQIERQFPVPLKMLGLSLASKELLHGEFPTSGM